MGCSNRGGGGCRRPRSGPEGPDGARITEVAAAGSGLRLMDGSSRATDSETAGRETHFGCWLSGPTPTAGFTELPSWGHGALGERLASTASRGRRVGRH
jgi:hypothetical protein